MTEADVPVDGEEASPHASAAAAFARRVREAGVPGVRRLILFGSAARADATGLSSDVDFLVVLADDADRPVVEDRLHDIAYDVMLEFGPVVELHVLSESRFDQRRASGHPFIRNIEQEGRPYA